MPMPCSDHAVLLKATAQHGRRETAVLCCGLEKNDMLCESALKGIPEELANSEALGQDANFHSWFLRNIKLFITARQWTLS